MLPRRLLSRHECCSLSTAAPPWLQLLHICCQSECPSSSSHQAGSVQPGRAPHNTTPEAHPHCWSEHMYSEDPIHPRGHLHLHPDAPVRHLPDLSSSPFSVSLADPSVVSATGFQYFRGVVSLGSIWCRPRHLVFPVLRIGISAVWYFD